MMGRSRHRRLSTTFGTVSLENPKAIELLFRDDSFPLYVATETDWQTKANK